MNVINFQNLDFLINFMKLIVIFGMEGSDLSTESIYNIYILYSSGIYLKSRIVYAARPPLPNFMFNLHFLRQREYFWPPPPLIRILC